MCNVTGSRSLFAGLKQICSTVIELLTYLFVNLLEIVYASQAPAKLPTALIIRHIFRTIFTVIYYLFRFTFVVLIWLAFLPYSILWIWRGLFHLAKGWGISWNAALKEIEWNTIGLSTLFMPHEEQQQFFSESSRNSTNTITSVISAKAAAGITPIASASKTAINNGVKGDLSEENVMTLSRMINGTIVSTSVKPKVEALEDAVADIFKAWFRSDDKAAKLQETVVDTAVTSIKTDTAASWLPRSSLIGRMLDASARALSNQWKAHKDTL